MILHRKLPAWLAIFAMALQAFWPLIAQAKPQYVQLVAVCSVAGTHYVPLSLPGETPLEKGSAAQGEHCKLCVFGADRFLALPPASPPALVVEHCQSGWLSPSAEGVYPSATHQPAQPRAPPLRS